MGVPTRRSSQTYHRITASNATGLSLTHLSLFLKTGLADDNE